MGKSRKDYEKFLNSISPDRDDEAWIIGGKNRYCGRENYGTMIKKFDVVLDNGEVEKCEGQWWDAVTDRAREELEKEGNPFSKMMLIGVSSVDRLSDCYVYYGLWASESKIEEMIADYKGRIYEYYEFKEDVIDKIRQLYT